MCLIKCAFAGEKNFEPCNFLYVYILLIQIKMFISLFFLRNSLAPIVSEVSRRYYENALSLIYAFASRSRFDNESFLLNGLHDGEGKFVSVCGVHSWSRAIEWQLLPLNWVVKFREQSRSWRTHGRSTDNFPFTAEPENPLPYSQKPANSPYP
jgi:hypothetical protein